MLLKSSDYRTNIFIWNYISFTDGNSAKEVYQISSPRGMCYDKSENELLVCHTDRKASWFQISLDV
jgi:hypothetical protein